MAFPKRNFGAYTNFPAVGGWDKFKFLVRETQSSNSISMHSTSTSDRRLRNSCTHFVANNVLLSIKHASEFVVVGESGPYITFAIWGGNVIR